MTSKGRWYILLINNFIARAAAIFLFFLALLTGLKDFIFENTFFLGKSPIIVFIGIVIVSIMLSAILTWLLKDFKIDSDKDLGNVAIDDGVKRSLFNRIGSSRSLVVYFNDEVDTFHKYTKIKRYDILNYADSNYRSIRELHGINASRKPTKYVPYCESTEYKVSFNDIKIIAYDIASGKKLKVECCHADKDEKLNTHSFRILFDKPLEPNHIFQIAFYIEFPNELDCLSQTKEIMTLSLVRVKKRIENVSFYIMLNFNPELVYLYSYSTKKEKLKIIPQHGESVREGRCSTKILGIREDILNNFPINKNLNFYIVGMDIQKPKESMYIIEYS